MIRSNRQAWWGNGSGPSVPCEPADAGRAARDRLDGKRVLVVEDEMLLALDLEEALRRAGCEVVGPAGNLRSALLLADAQPVDAAILDVNLAGEAVFPVAERLADRDVPFVFATAYSSSDEIYPPEVRSAPRLAKPYTVSQALNTLRQIIGR